MSQGVRHDAADHGPMILWDEPDAPAFFTKEVVLVREGGPRRDVLTFSIGGEDYALGIQSIREIIKNRPITEVPRVPPFVAGIITVRGVVMPVIDLRLRLRLLAPPLTEKARILVVLRPADMRIQEPFGLLVDRVYKVVQLPEQDIEPPTMLSAHETDFVSGIGRLETEPGQPRPMLILLDLLRVLSFEPGSGLLTLGAAADHGGHRGRHGKDKLP